MYSDFGYLLFYLLLLVCLFKSFSNLYYLSCGFYDLLFGGYQEIMHPLMVFGWGGVLSFQNVCASRSHIEVSNAGFYPISLKRSKVARKTAITTIFDWCLSVSTSNGVNCFLCSPNLNFLSCAKTNRQLDQPLTLGKPLVRRHVIFCLGCQSTSVVFTWFAFNRK